MKVNGDSADFDGQTSQAQWAFVYHEYDEGLANDIIAAFRKVQGTLGVQLRDEPQYIQIPNDKQLRDDGLQFKSKGDNYLKFIHCIEDGLSSRRPTDVAIVFVLVPYAEDKPRIKKRLDTLGFASQFMLKSKMQ